ncbi:MAG: hypothetical protein WD069_14900 [Planctomycetales bacterium]
MRLLLLTVLAGYVCSFAALSRDAIRRAEASNTEGYYFSVANGVVNWKIHATLRVIYSPLIFVDRFAGSGKSPASMPLDQLN